MPRRKGKMSNAQNSLAEYARHATLQGAKKALLKSRLLKDFMPRSSTSAVAQVSERPTPEPHASLPRKTSLLQYKLPQKTSFLHLPPEIRNAIYGFITPKVWYDIETPLSHGRTRRQNHAMNKVHPQIAQEWNSLLFQDMTLFSHMSGDKRRAYNIARWDKWIQTLSDAEALSIERILFVASWSARPRIVVEIFRERTKNGRRVIEFQVAEGTDLEEREIWDIEKEVLDIEREFDRSIGKKALTRMKDLVFWMQGMELWVSKR